MNSPCFNCTRRTMDCHVPCVDNAVFQITDMILKTNHKKKNDKEFFTYISERNAKCKRRMKNMNAHPIKTRTYE